MTKPEVYTPRTLAKHWQCSERSVRRVINEGKLVTFRVGNLYRIPRRAVEEYEEHNTVVADFPDASGPPDNNLSEAEMFLEIERVMALNRNID